MVVLTTSRAEQDVLQAYKYHANCYITKPVDFEQFLNVVRSIECFWLMVVTLPPAPQSVRAGAKGNGRQGECFRPEAESGGRDAALPKEITDESEMLDAKRADVVFS